MPRVCFFLNFFLWSQKGFSGPTHFEGTSGPGMHEGSVLEPPGLRPPAHAGPPPFFHDSKTMGDHGLPIKYIGTRKKPFPKCRCNQGNYNAAYY
jgi:hypothetical protein